LGWKESKIHRKRRKKVEFDLTLLADKAKMGGIRLFPARGKSKKKRGERTMRSRVKKFESPAVMAHDKKNERRLDLPHPILLLCQNCGFEGLQSEWVKRGESKQSKPKLTCPRCGSSEHRETA
jgi:hypothetical protein